jgi:molybdopterin-guanine dinucleotide biosynthesis protein A
MNADLPAIILAGGRATRMGGGDKALVQLGGRPLISHVIARLAPQCSRLALSANGEASRFSTFGLPVVADTIADHPGPLAGILAGLDYAAETKAEAIVTAAVDTPFLPLDLVVRLKTAAGRSGLALAASPDQAGTMRIHPTFGLWPVRHRHQLRTALESGLRKAAMWAESHDAGIATFTSGPHDPFFNVNTPEDVAAAERILAAGG